MKTKICSKCKIEKILSEFYKDNKSKDGYRSECKICSNILHLKYNLAHRQQIQKQQKEYRILNKEKIFQINKNYYVENLEKIKENQQNYYQLNKIELKKKMKKYRIENPEINIFNHIKDRCENPKNPSYCRYGGRGIKCNITKEEIRKLWERDKAYLMKQPSIDRIDNDCHYIYNNCQFIEKSENSKKASISQRKPILQFDLQGNFIKEWESLTLASENTDISIGDIWRVANNQRKSAKGFIWKYK